jgi:large subunit ribosomal protein LP1
MASKEVSALTAAEKDELCCSYAALMLHDDGVEITAERLA